MKFGHVAMLAGVLASGVLGLALPTAPAVYAANPAKPAKPAISEEASAALLRMGQTLSAEQFSFQVRTIRVYSDANGELLHIFHTIKVVAHRPNELLVDVTGDDGSDKMVFGGKTAVVYSAILNKYASIPVPGERSKRCCGRSSVVSASIFHLPTF